MAHVRSRFPRARGTIRRKTAWIPGPFGTSGVLSATGSALIATAVQITADATTLVRTRGELLIQLLSADDVGNAGGMIVGVGLCLVSENAIGVGITAISTPLTDEGWDGWFFHWAGNLRAQEMTLLGQQVAATARIPIDNKAMRKIRATDSLVGVVEVVENGVATLSVEMETRMLLKLP